MKKNVILAINPGSTSTKISIFSEEDEVYTDTIFHDYSKCKNIIEQKDVCYNSIITSLEKSKYSLSDIAIVMARGGILRPVKSGIYKINKKMLQDLKNAVGGEHASNIAAFIAYRISKEKNIPSFIVDPISVDEMIPVARISGFKGIERKSLSHALNIRRVCFLSADELNKPINELNLIVAHLGGGISIAAVNNGLLIDVESANSLGAFSLERCGGLPFLELIDLCYSGKYSKNELKSKLINQGGLYSYLKTKDIREVEERIKLGDDKAKLVLEAMIYQISKTIGEMATVLKGDVDRILLTGGIAHSDFVCKRIKERTSFIAKTKVYPGESEMRALQEAAIRLIEGKEKIQEYLGDEQND